MILDLIAEINRKILSQDLVYSNTRHRQIDKMVNYSWCIIIASLDRFIGLENHRDWKGHLEVIWFNLSLKQDFPEQLPRSTSKRLLNIPSMEAPQPL